MSILKSLLVTVLMPFLIAMVVLSITLDLLCSHAIGRFFRR
jgi:hypothetical protein